MKLASSVTEIAILLCVSINCTVGVLNYLLNRKSKQNESS